MKEATIVVGDDWEGVYIDGELLTEGHSIDTTRLLRELGFCVVHIEPNSEWLEGEGYLPKYLSDVVLEGEQP